MRQEGVERARVERLIEVVAAVDVLAPPAPARASAVAVTIGNPYVGLTLRVNSLGAAGRGEWALRVWLGGNHLDGQPIEEPIIVPGDAQDVVAELCRDLSGLLKLSGPPVQEQRLGNIGAALAERLLPKPVREALADPRFAEGTPLHIESDDAWIPWEALHLGSGGAGAFLGERFAVTRWLRTGRLLEEIGIGPAVLVVAQGSGLQVEDERRALHSLKGAPPQERGGIADVMDLFGGTPPVGVLHLACHGGLLSQGAITLKGTLNAPTSQLAAQGDFTSQRPLREMLVMEGGSLRVVDVRGPLGGALVFLNACQAGIGEPSLWDHHGWAGALLRVGAGAVVAPSWVVRDVDAAAFAAAFYREAAGGRSTLGEAARLARRSARRQGVPDRIGFAIYAAPLAKLGGGRP